MCIYVYVFLSVCMCTCAHTQTRMLFIMILPGFNIIDSVPCIVCVYVPVCVCIYIDIYTCVHIYTYNEIYQDLHCIILALPSEFKIGTWSFYPYQI